MTSPLRRKRPTTASGWRNSTDGRGAHAGRRAALAAGLLMAALLGLNLPHALADSYDLAKPAGQSGWSARTQKSSPAVARPAAPALKWRGQSAVREPARSAAHNAKPISAAAPAKGPAAKGVSQQNDSPSTGPALAAPQVRRAVHEAEADSRDEIRLISLTAPDDDPAADPFQDELADEEEMEGEDEGNEEKSDDASWDEEDPAGRAMAFDSLDELSPGPEEPDLDIRSQLPRLGEAYAQAGPNEPERCPSPRDLKPINQIDHRIAAEPGLFPQECALSEEPFQPRRFTPVTFTWKASALAHKPLWFQQPKLERYGHTFGPVLTPIIAAGHFFVMVPCLPYNMGMEPPWECVYSLGWYRPGDCAPYTLGPLPLSAQGAATQAVITTGLWFLFP